MKKQNSVKSKDNIDSDSKRPDNSVKVAIIGAVATLVTTIITALIAPILIDKTRETPIPKATDSKLQETASPIKTISHKVPFRVGFEYNSENDDLSAEELFLVYQDGSRLYLTDNDFMDRGGAFSPDNKLISFIRRIDRNEDGKIFWDDNADLYIMNNDGSNVIQVTDNFCDVGWGTWSPDGKNIAFACEQSENDDFLYVYELSTGSIVPIYIDEKIGGEQWSPDGKYIAFYNSQNCVAIIQPNGNNYQVLSDDVGNGWGLFWTADGNIIFPFQEKGYLIFDPYKKTSTLLDKDAEVNQLKLRIYQEMYNWSSYINVSQAK